MWPLWVTSSIWVLFALIIAAVPVLFLDPESGGRTYVGIAIPLLTLATGLVQYVLVTKPLNGLSEKIDAALEQRDISEGHQRNVLRSVAQAEAAAGSGAAVPTGKMGGSSSLSLQYSMRHQQKLVEETTVDSYHNEMFHLQAHIKDLFQSLIREQQSLYKLQSETTNNKLNISFSGQTAGTPGVAAQRTISDSDLPVPKSPPPYPARNRDGFSTPTARGRPQGTTLGRRTSDPTTLPDDIGGVRIRGPVSNDPTAFPDAAAVNGSRQPTTTFVDIPSSARGTGKALPTSGAAFDEFVSCNSEDDDEPLEAISFDDLHVEPHHHHAAHSVGLSPAPPPPTSRPQVHTRNLAEDSAARSESAIVPSPTMKPSKGASGSSGAEEAAPRGVGSLGPLTLIRGKRYPDDNKNVCLILRRSKNANIVVYEAKVENPLDSMHEPALSVAETLEGYWQDLDPKAQAKKRKKGIMSDRDDLNYIEKKMAYGFSCTRSTTEIDAYTVTMVALPTRPMTLRLKQLPFATSADERSAVEFVPIMCLKINGVDCVLESIYVHATEPKHVWNLPTVEYIELHGFAMKTGDRVMETVIPK